ncbi:hypothetical protein BDZ85DRAFT_260954 [Elsinoe ampelina]|uniref:Uncharacterized protein n=1 Tax=Elsinoe ampelina TaxID=302913 RepID=A0A6A6GFN2_9PEZI|nr:hypothetical protein BDZ85DRAFT_260954 [Elsinoe ampelina]
MAPRWASWLQPNMLFRLNFYRIHLAYFVFGMLNSSVIMYGSTTNGNRGNAYGTVGLTPGVPFDDFAFSGDWHMASKLILVVVMLRGRHRGLPYAIDRAVPLPGEEEMERMDKEIKERGRDRRYKRDEDELRREEVGEQAEDDRTGKAQGPQQQTT